MGNRTRNSQALRARQVRRSLTQIDPSNSHPQLQSPLFGIIPPEIRNQIFELSVSQHDDLKHPHPDANHMNNHFLRSMLRRPGREYELVTWTELLRTCRLVYYETNSIPMRSATHYFPRILSWRGIGPGDYEWLSHFTSKNVRELGHVYCYGRMLGFRELTHLPQFRPKRITYTVRQIDWDWDEFRSGRILGSEVRKIIKEPMPASLECFVLELEALMENKRKFEDAIKENGSTHRITLPNGRILSSDTNAVEFSSWRGLCYDSIYSCGDLIIAKFTFTEECTSRQTSLVSSNNNQ